MGLNSDLFYLSYLLQALPGSLVTKVADLEEKTPIKPSLFAYTEYRKYLKDIYFYRKELDHKFSHRFIALHVGATSSGWFAGIINNKINLTGSYLTSLCKLLQLKQRESDYFEILVSYDQSGTLEEKNKYLQKILTFKGVDPAVIMPEQFEFYSKWYISAIRELLLFFRFRDDYKELAKTLNPPIRPAEAIHAVELLLSLGLIEKDNEGFLKPVKQTITKDSAFRSTHWGNYMSAMIKLALESIDRHEKEIRDISSVTIGLSPESWIIAKNEIACLRNKLLSLSEQDKKHSAVYQCNIQLFPLSQINKGIK